MQNEIVKTIEVKAPVSRVWNALTDYQQFGQWFGCKISGAFAPSKDVQAQITTPGYEHITMTFHVEQISPEHTFSYKWHPHPVDPAVDYAAETPTLVEFKLEPTSKGTKLTVTESGFEKLPPERRKLALLRNAGGWEIQLKNIEKYVRQHA